MTAELCKWTYPHNRCCRRVLSMWGPTSPSCPIVLLPHFCQGWGSAEMWGHCHVCLSVSLHARAMPCDLDKGCPAPLTAAAFRILT